jgi:NitT/TauT family transport system permease protein
VSGHGPQYVLDTNVFIQAKNDYYAFDICPGFWTALKRHGRVGNVLSIDRVHDELEKGHDGLSTWVKGVEPGFFKQTGDQRVIAEYGALVAWVQKQPQFTAPAKNEFMQTDNADPWVVAYAKVNGCVVVRLRVMNRFFQAGPPILLFVVVLIVWQGAVMWFDLPVYLLPSPWRVATEAASELPTIADATRRTATAAVCGFVASLFVGTLIGFVFSQSAMIRNSCYPYAIFLQTVPIVAIAPLIITWFDYGFHSVVIVAFIISLFPIITNATAGMLAIDPLMLDLFRLYDASRWQVLIKLRLPTSVPYLVAGAKTSSGLAVVGAIVGEFLCRRGRGPVWIGLPDPAKDGTAPHRRVVRCRDRFHRPGSRDLCHRQLDG